MYNELKEFVVIEDVVPIPPGMKPIGCRFVYTEKDAVIQEDAQIIEKTVEKACLTIKVFKNYPDDNSIGDMVDMRSY